MRREGNLEVYDITLSTLGPVFVGAGYKYKKNAYLFDADRNEVSFVDEEALFDWLVRSGNVDEYEEFVLGSKGQDLELFLRGLGMKREDRRSIVRYSVSASAVMDSAHSLKEIDAFIRNARGEAYVPGSSLKGALRTVLCAHMGWVDNRFDAKLNGIMHGISISDSAPIPNDGFALARKVDLRADGVRKSPNLVRECIGPGVKLHMSMTLDRRATGDIDGAAILNAVSEFYKFYRNTFSKRFINRPTEYAPQSGACIFLGGGAGFFSKTLVYPQNEYYEALHIVSELMKDKFKKHKHELDEYTHKISPHCLKYGNVNGQYLEFGLCEVSIE